MLKTHDLKTVYFNCMAVNYFYIREKNDRNGNPRYRVFVIDPEGPAVYERIFKTYCVTDSVIKFLEDMQK